MSKAAYDKIAAGLADAIAIANGEKKPAGIYKAHQNEPSAAQPAPRRPAKNTPKRSASTRSAQNRVRRS